MRSGKTELQLTE